jgi:HSP20 family protein
MESSKNPFGEMERFFDQVSKFTGGIGSEVPVDVVDAGDSFVVTANLPGFDTGEIGVELLDDRRLRVSAETDREETTERGQFLRRERTRQSISRTVSLPEAVDESETEASYSDGVLTVHLGKETGDADGTDIPVS